MVCHRWRHPAAFILLLLPALSGWLLSGLARAHVSVEPQKTSVDARVTYRLIVPTERDVPTVRVELVVPEAVTIIRFQAKPGWQREVVQDATTGRITRVIWHGGAIGPGEFDEFVFQARNPREPATVVWKVYQIYSSGERVAWEQPPEGAHSHGGHASGHGEGGSGPAAVTIVTAGSQ